MKTEISQLRSDLASQHDYNSGDWLLGCAAIPEITPRGKLLGESATLHEMLEGMLDYAGAGISAVIINPATPTRNTIQPTAVDVINISLKQFAGQTAAYIRGLDSADAVQWSIDSTGLFSTAGAINTTTGYRFNGTATSGQYLRGNGTNIVLSAIQAADLPGSFSGLANPTGTIGLTAVNGSATTAPRSDGAPALSQAISPTWSGSHTFSLLITATGGILPGLGADGAGRIFQSSVNGLKLRGVTASTNDFGIFSEAGTLVMRIPTGTATVAFPVAVSMASTLNATGLITATGGVEFGLGTGADGRIFRSSVSGLFVRGVAGSSYDMVLGNAGGTHLIRNPTGTTNLSFPNAVTIGSTLDVVTGYRFNGTATTGQYLRGNGTNIVLSAIQAGDVPNLSGTNTGDQTITLTGDVTGSGTGSFAVTIANNAVTDAKLRDSAALSVIGRSANSTGDPADIAASVDGQILRRSGTTIGFGTINGSAIDDDTVALAKLPNIATDSFLGRDTAGTGDVEVLSVATVKTLLNLVGTNSGDQTITLTGAVTGSGTGSFATALATNIVENTNIRNSVALSVMGRSANSGGNPADISTTSGTAAVLRESGGVLGFGTIDTGGIANDAVTSAKFRNSVGMSVVGRDVNSSGDVGDLVASVDGQILRRSGTTVGFGTISGAAIDTDSIQFASITNIATARVLGRNTAGTGDIEVLATLPSAVQLNITQVGTLTSLTVDGTTSLGDDLTLSYGNVGDDARLNVTNTDNTNGASTAQIRITSGGASGGDAFIRYDVTGVTAWAHGIDNSASDSWVLAQSGVLGTTNRLKVTTGGNVRINHDVSTSEPVLGVGGEIGFGGSKYAQNVPPTTPGDDIWNDAPTPSRLKIKYWTGSAWEKWWIQVAPNTTVP